MSITGQDLDANQVLLQKLSAQIDSLEKQIAAILAQKQGVAASQNSTCSKINDNLYFGISDIGDVKCLQSFLKNQGTDIYPEGLVTGNFGNLTKAAVINFQKKYGILSTGYVGQITRNKINSILNGG